MSTRLSNCQKNLPRAVKTRTVVMFVYGNLFPVAMGSQRVICEIVHFLRRAPGISLRLVVVGDECAESRKVYRDLCDDVRWIPPPPRWSMWQVINKVVSRVGIDLFRAWGTALALRRAVLRELQDADIVLLNYLVWFPLIPQWLRGRTLVITHDLLFYRRASFWGTESLFKRVWIALNRWMEVRCLRTFVKIGVFAEYEQRLLQESRIPVNQMVCLGMPISVMPMATSVKKLYDFLFVAGNSYQNEQGVKRFMEGVAPLLAPRRITFAVAGGLCQSSIWETLEVPEHVKVYRLGYVDDLSQVFADARIGVGTLPFGSGVKVKVVETALYGLPLVLTETGAEGIPLPDGAWVNIDRLASGEIRRGLLTWLDNPSAAESAGRAVQLTVREKFAPEKALAPLKAWIEE